MATILPQTTLAAGAHNFTTAIPGGSVQYALTIQSLNWAAAHGVLSYTIQLTDGTTTVLGVAGTLDGGQLAHGVTAPIDNSVGILDPARVPGPYTQVLLNLTVNQICSVGAQVSFS